MTVLKAENVVVNRGGKAILHGISTRFEAGSFTAIIGANGAGKSTFLNAAAGLYRPDAGEVTLDGEAIAGLSPRALARRRAFVPQSPRCEWPISVERLVALGLTPVLPAFGGLPEAMEAEIAQVLDAFDLTEHRSQPATTLSGGELARAMLARALVCNPQILMADEPMAGLDPRHALDTVARLRRLARAGKMVVATVHDLTLAARFADRILCLRDGRVIADGPTRTTLTSGLVRAAFDVDACVVGTGEGAYVDFTAPPPPPMGQEACIAASSSASGSSESARS